VGGRQDVLLAVAIAASAMVIVLGLLVQVWVAALQLRQFARIFAGRPELVTALNRVFAIYGWRAGLAARLFRIPLPPGVPTSGR
jgi:hypothetical protein